MRSYLSDLLEETWNVVCVSDGQEALDEIRRQQPDLILSDVMMP